MCFFLLTVAALVTPGPRLFQLSLSYSLNRGVRILLVQVVQLLRTYLFAPSVGRHVENVY